MSDDQSMSVKAFLDGGKDHQEVRRFGMPESLATNFSALKAKICSVFNIGNQDIIITWKDSEGDFIVISSDEELVEAIADSLSRQKLQVFRVNVTIRSSKPSDGQGPNSGTQGNQQGDVHEGVVCDVCDKTIVGFRYNCVTCQDFDLCGVCESKGMHKEHKMIRMPKPPTRGEPRFWWKEHEGPGGQHSTQFGMQSGGNEEEGNSFSFASSSTGPGPQVGGWCGWGPWMGRGGRPCNRAGGRGHGGWRGWWGKNWNGARGTGGFWQGQGQTLGGNANQQQQQQQQSQSQGRAQENQQEQHQSQQNSSRNDDDCPWTNTNGGPCPFSNGHPGIPIPDPAKVAENAQYAAQEAQKMAHHVAHHFATQMATDQVANVMKGIWTAWAGQQPQGASTSYAAAASASTSSSSSSSATAKDNENPMNGQTKNTSNGPSPTPNEQFLRNVGESVASMLEPMGIDVDVSVEHNGIRQRCSLNDSDLQSRNSPTSKSPTAPSTPVPQADNTPTAPSNANMEVQTDSPENVSNLMEVSSPPGAEPQMESDVEDWTMVNRDSNSPENRPVGTKPHSNSPENRPTSETNRTTLATEGPVSYPDLQQFQTHPDPKIQRALEQMQSMGYNNEGGWLSNLLEMKQGDINQVLDLLQPVNK